MCIFKIIAVLAIVMFSFNCIVGIPLREFSREKRTSDQRLAELETLFALSKMNGKLVTVPIGFGKIDPSKLGRRRRSIGRLLRQLINNLSTEEKLSHEIIRTIVEPRDAGDENGESSKLGKYLFSDDLNLISHPRLPVKLPD